MTAVAGSGESNTLFGEQELAGTALDLLELAADFLGNKTGDFRAQLDIYANGVGPNFYNLSFPNQFVDLDAIHNQRPVYAKYHFEYELGKDAVCTLFGGGLDMGQYVAEQRLGIKNGVPVLMSRMDAGHDYAFLPKPVGHEIIAKLAKDAFDMADAQIDEDEPRAEEPQTEPDGYHFSPRQAEVLPVLGKLLPLATRAVRGRGQGVSVSSTVLIDTGPRRLYQMSPVGYDDAANCITIATHAKDAWTQFYFKAEPELSTGFAMARAQLDISERYKGEKIHTSTRLYEADGEVREVCVQSFGMKEELLNDRPVRWQEAVLELAHQAVAATKGQDA